MITLQGIPKPTFHAFRLLHSLGDEVLYRDDDHGIVTRDSKTGLLSAIMFHYPPEMKTSPPPTDQDREAAEDVIKVGVPTRKQIILENLTPGASFRVEVLAPGRRGDVVWAWQTLGSPATLNRQLEKQLRDFATLDLSFLTADNEGRLVYEEALQPWTLVAVVQVKTA